MAGFIVKVIPQGASKPAPIDMSDQVITFKFEDEEAKADKLTLTVDNWDLRNCDNPIWADGNLVRVIWGDEQAISLERELVIKDVKGSTVLTIEALAKSVLLNQEKKARTFEHKTYAQIAAQIALEYGYGASEQEIDDSEILWPCVTQPGVSDAVFLRHLANRLRWEWFIDWDGFHFHPRRLGQRPLRTLIYFTDPGRGDIETFNFDGDLTARPQGPVGAVQIKGKDPKEKTKINVTANDGTTKSRDTNASVAKVVDKQTGVRTYKPRSVVTTSASTAAPNAAAAKQAASGAYVKSQAKAVLFTWSGPGIADLVAKSIIEVVFPGVKSITGNYYVTTLIHELSASGPYKISGKARRDGSSAIGTSPGTATEPKTQAKVNDLDPAKKGELIAVKKVDPQSGARSYAFRDTKGREKKQ